MKKVLQPCRTVIVLVFRGDRTRTGAILFQKSLDAERNGRGPGPSLLDSQLFGGHAGISTDGGQTVFGFGPDRSGLQVWQMMERLKNGEAVKGAVREDSGAFSLARTRGLIVRSLNILLPDTPFQRLVTSLDEEFKTSQYSYGFPNGDGDCNYITWIERMGLPLLTGRISEFVGLPAMLSLSRRFGQCV